MSRTTIFLALFVVGVVLAVILLPRGRDSGNDATVAESITLYGYADDGAPLWQIRARSGQIGGSDQTFTNVSIDFYEQEASPLHVEVDRLDRSRGVSRLAGGVRVERADDFLLETEEMTWDEAAERLAAGRIDLSAEHLQVAAEGFGYDLETRTASFTGGVEASADLKTAWTIRADRAEERSGLVSFQGDVTAASADGESFRCARFDVDTETETATLSGGVVGKWSSGDLSAESVRLDDEGIRAAGGVSARIGLEERTEPDDT